MSLSLEEQKSKNFCRWLKQCILWRFRPNFNPEFRKNPFPSNDFPCSACPPGLPRSVRTLCDRSDGRGRPRWSYPITDPFPEIIRETSGWFALFRQMILAVWSTQICVHMLCRTPIARVPITVWSDRAGQRFTQKFSNDRVGQCSGREHPRTHPSYQPSK